MECCSGKSRLVSSGLQPLVSLHALISDRLHSNYRPAEDRYARCQVPREQTAPLHKHGLDGSPFRDQMYILAAHCIYLVIVSVGSAVLYTPNCAVLTSVLATISILQKKLEGLCK